MREEKKYNEQGQILITFRQILLRLRRTAQLLSLGEIRNTPKYLGCRGQNLK